MERTFKMAWGKGTLYGSIIGVFMELLLIFVFFKVGLIYFGFGLLTLFGLLMWFQYAAFQKNRYEINGNDLIVKCIGDKKRIYPIDKIQKIQLVDYGTEWVRPAPTSRHQLLLYFDRKYFKSVEPRRFGPEDREAFVNTLLEINTNIEVVKEEIKL
ncbi:MAG: PH domain-containing protein [Muribaculum sp.]|nr:PH domain-containing protein [Muribaculum sp.]